MVEEVKKTWVKTSQTIEVQRCILVDLWVTSTADGVAGVTIYDSASVGERETLVLKVPVNQTYHLSPEVPIVLDNGLSISLDYNVYGVLVLSKAL